MAIPQPRPSAANCRTVNGPEQKNLLFTIFSFIDVQKILHRWITCL